MKNKIRIFSIILLGVSIIITPLVFMLTDQTKELSRINNEMDVHAEPTENNNESVETSVVSNTVPTVATASVTSPVIEPTETTICPTVEATISSETNPVEEVPPETTEIIIETNPKASINEVPLYNQWDYPNVYYGERANVSVATHGDGMTTLAMVATYLLDDPTFTPDVIAKMFSRYDSNQGTSWMLFLDSAKELGLGEVRQAWDWNVGNIEDALRNGSIIICCQGSGVFTDTGHYILLTGITEDGKILVNDSNGYNYEDPSLQPMFKEGFEPEHIYSSALSYWVYPVKALSNN